MNTPKISLPLLGFLVLISCNPKDKEKELEKREKELANKEKIFAEKEADYQALLKMNIELINQGNKLVILN